MRKISATTSGARPNDGSSSSSRLGRSSSARAIASICCSPPDSVPACWLQPLGEAREIAEHALEIGLARLRRSRAHIGAEPQVLLDGQIGERAAPVRHMRDAEPRDVLRRASAPIGRPRKSISPSRRIIALSARSDRRLAGAVGAEQRRDAAFLDLEIDAVQRLDRAVERLRGPSRRRIGGSSRAPEIGADHLGMARTSAGVPSAISRPKSSATTWSETRMTRFM